jgi:hypothetical protein
VATIPTPRTWASGEQVTAAKLNADVRDGFNFLLAPPRAVLRKSAQPISSGILTVLSWDLEDLDSDGGHSNVTNNTRYTVQTAGWFFLICNVEWSDTNDVGGREVWFRKSGNNATRQSRSDDYPTVSTTNINMSGLITTGYMSLAVSDYIEVEVFQSSGTTMSVESNARFDIRWVRT